MFKFITIIAKVFKIVSNTSISSFLPECASFSILNGRSIERLTRYGRVQYFMADVLLIAIRSGPNRRHSGLDHELILADSFAGTELDIAAR